MARVKRFKPPKVTTLIGEATAITGDVVFSAGLHLDGKIIGNVNGEPDTRSTLIVSEQGEVKGDVRVDNLVLNGTVVGDVYANERVELATNARVTGTVYYCLLEMAMGAEVNGKLVHTEEGEPRRIGYDGNNEKAVDAAEEPAADTSSGVEANT